MAKFRHPSMVKVYDSLTARAPTTGTGGGLDHAYVVGRNHPAHPCPYIRTSLCYAAWRAGQDAAKKEA